MFIHDLLADPKFLDILKEQKAYDEARGRGENWPLREFLNRLYHNLPIVEGTMGRNPQEAVLPNNAPKGLQEFPPEMKRQLHTPTPAPTYMPMPQVGPRHTPGEGKDWFNPENTLPPTKKWM